MGEIVALGAYLSDRRRVEMSLLATMLFRSLEALKQREHYEVREDIWRALDVASVRALRDLSPDRIRKLALRVVRDADTVLRASGADTRRQLALIVATTVLRLVEEGVVEDVQDQAVLVSLAIRREAEEDPEVWGALPSAVEDKAGRMVERLRLAGYFQGRGLRGLAGGLSVS